MSAIPKVSVILPLAAPPANLQRAMASVLSQGMAELELIVVDASSEDSGLEAAVAEFAQADSRVQYLRSDADGLAQAAAAGLRAARADWIAFQRDGDEWLFDRLGQQLAFVAKHGEETDMVAGRLLQYMPVAKTRMCTWGMPSGGGRLAHGKVAQNFVALLQTTLIRRAVLEAAGAFNPQGHDDQDFVWCDRLLEKGRISAAPSCVAVTYVSSGIEMPHPTIDWLRKALKR